MECITAALPVDLLPDSDIYLFIYLFTNSCLCEDRWQTESLNIVIIIF